VETGSEDVTVRANRKYKEILQNAPETLIDPEVDQALNDYIKDKKLLF
jgi:trimethylamine--corrinoid protein Co-methyltransferase